jgi:hypothetical protein
VSLLMLAVVALFPVGLLAFLLLLARLEEWMIQSRSTAPPDRSGGRLRIARSGQSSRPAPS